MNMEEQGYGANSEAPPSSFFNQMGAGSIPVMSGPDVTRSSYFGGEDKTRSTINQVLKNLLQGLLCSLFDFHYFVQNSSRPTVHQRPLNSPSSRYNQPSSNRPVPPEFELPGARIDPPHENRAAQPPSYGHIHDPNHHSERRRVFTPSRTVFSSAQQVIW